MSARHLVVVGAVAGLGGAALGQTAQLRALGVLDQRSAGSAAYGLSSDGRFIVGGSLAPDGAGLRMHACRWAFPVGGDLSGPVALPEAETRTDFGSLALAVSDDGQRTVGSIGMVQEFFYGPQYSAWHAMYWWDLAGPVTRSDWIGPIMEFTDISADGQVVCGTSRGPNFEPIPGDAVRWTGPASQPEVLGTLGGFSAASACSVDGSLIVGEAFNALGGAVNSFIWDAANGMQQLPNTPSHFWHTAQGMCPDGAVIVGATEADASIWSRVAGIQSIGRPPGSSYAYALDVTADGRVVVGYGVTDDDTRTLDAFIWDAGHGMRSVGDVLLQDYGVDSSGWHFDAATAIADDGQTIIGYAHTPGGRVEGFVVRVGGPACAADFNGDGVVNSQDLFDFLLAFFQSDPTADFNHDGVINSQDFFDFLAAFFVC